LIRSASLTQYIAGIALLFSVPSNPTKPTLKPQEASPLLAQLRFIISLSISRFF
jgi:hypothetical protein